MVPLKIAMPPSAISSRTRWVRCLNSAFTLSQLGREETDMGWILWQNILDIIQAGIEEHQVVRPLSTSCLPTANFERISTQHKENTMGLSVKEIKTRWFVKKGRTKKHNEGTSLDRRITFFNTRRHSGLLRSTSSVAMPSSCVLDTS